MPEIIWKLAAVLSPFLSAGIAGWIAYTAGRKKSKADAFLNRRLDALEKIHVCLVKLRSYVENRINELHGNEYAPHPEKDKDINSYVFPLWEARDHEDLFLTKNEREKLNEVDDAMGMVRSMERICNSDPESEQESKESAIKLYSNISKTTTSAINTLYSELRKEYGI